MRAVFLQARLNSRRFPEKVLYQLEDITVLQMAMRALKQINCDRHVVLCDVDSAPQFLPLVRQEGFDLVCGHSEDVLDRFAFAAETLKVDWIIRATADNPLVSAMMADRLLQEELSADYCGYTGIPLGTGVEYVRASALLQADREAVSPYDREHVCPYLYHHPEKFRSMRVPAPMEFCDDFSVTLDTIEDYRLLQRIFSLRNPNFRGRPMEISELKCLYQKQ